MKTIIDIPQQPKGHWVGDGFPVHSLFSYHSHGQDVSPFLLLDYSGPAEFTPAITPRGVGPHPHRGFETVTLVYDGEVAHRDSTGDGGVIGPGDVQWMTAGAGILHEEFHSPAFTQKGGTMKMIQLWVNLPAAHKMTQPRYQGITKDQIPTVSFDNGNADIRIIAGEFEGQKGPAKTFSPIDVIEINFANGQPLSFPVRDGWNTILVVLKGSIAINDAAPLNDTHVAVLSASGSSISITGTKGAQALILSGEPLNEPIIGRGPFVMNTQTEINQAIEDFREGKFGHM